ncbi:MAG: immunity 53 family protein [Cyanobacteria bacterium SZAS LIN-3]|nr:immunity 53 family protein [Cyanobacteria bacterium SZAS LIN-3]
MDILERLQKWYASRCNGEWEHQYGIKLDNIDNPGWALAVDLLHTELQPREFSKIEKHRSENDWIVCEVTDSRFHGVGGPGNLTEILTTFLSWAETV